MTTFAAAEREDWEAVGQGGVKTGVAAVGAVAAGAGIAGAMQAAARGAAVARGVGPVGGDATFVYQLVDEAGGAVWYGISNNPLRRLGEHARTLPGPWRGMQIISEPLPRAHAEALETSLMQQAVSEGRTIYNVGPLSISSIAPVQVPLTVTRSQSLLNYKIYQY